MEVGSQLHAPDALPLANSPPYSLPKGLGAFLSPRGRNADEKRLFLLPGIEPQLLGRPARSAVAIPIGLCRLWK
jgi:hypothetical protein